MMLKQASLATQDLCHTPLALVLESAIGMILAAAILFGQQGLRNELEYIAHTHMSHLHSLKH